MRVLRTGFMLGGLALLAACNTTTPENKTSVEDTLGLETASNTEPSAPDLSRDLRAFCPNTTIRQGTETYRTFSNGVKKTDPDALSSLQFQATINQVARECNYSPNNLNMRVGVRGRMINGPSGETGTLTLPVRIAVVNTSKEVLYSVLHQVPATIQPGSSNAPFSYVDGAINLPVPERPNLIVYVGFDEGPPTATQ